MTPAEFQSVALAWIGVASVVGAAAIGAGYALYSSLKARINFHRDDIKTLTADVKDLNRALPASAPSATLPVPAQQDTSVPAAPRVDTPVTGGSDPVPATAPPAAVNQSTVLDRDALLSAIAAMPTASATIAPAVVSAGVVSAGTEGD